MSFWIQISNPITIRPQDKRCADLSEAIEAIFPMDTEDAFLAWNATLVPMGYKYDISVMIDDLLPLLEHLLSAEEGHEEVHWASSTFNARWVISWERQDLRILSEWFSVAGDLERILNYRNQLVFGRHDFLAEWKMLVGKLLDCIRGAGVEIEDAEQLARLGSCFSRIEGVGRLYRPRH